MIACNTKNTQENVSATFNQMLEKFYLEGLELDPMTATEKGESRFNNIFPDYLSDAYRVKKKEYYSEYLEKASQFEDSTLSEEEIASKAILIWKCKSEIEEINFQNDYFPIDQMWSKNLKIAQWADGTGAQPFKTVKDYENWLQRMDGYVVWLSSAERKMREGIDKDYVLPKSLILKVIPQLEAMANADTENHLFYSPVKIMPETFSKEEKEKISKEYTEMVNQKIIPAYQQLLDFTRTDYLAAGRETSGIDAIPNGQAYYEYCIKVNTTTNLTADEIFQLGLREVARIRNELEVVKEQVGYSGDLNSFFNYVRNKKELMPFTDPQQVIDNFKAINERIKPQLEKLFDKTPRTAFEIRRTEAFREKSSSAEYNYPAIDGSRPGIFYVPIPDVKTYNVFGDESLFLHEAIPGHHYQIALAMENELLPKFRKILWLNAYGEGWALYAESLGKELGLYTDPYQYFGMLSEEMHRAIRLVVDAGMHAKGWTREQAIQYSLENEAEPEGSIVAEIERYMANPGQALGYKMGQLKILELRHKAEKEFGDKFDIREFHNQVLEPGCLPLDLLTLKIDKWIAASQ